MGNLKSRTQGTPSANEAFTYDVLNRLTGWSGTPGTGSVTYSAIGNIESKSDVGSYFYGSKPHAVTAAGSNNYAYDANGNMQTRNGQSITWSYANLPTHIQKDASNFSDFSYSASRARYKQVAQVAGVVETTRYVGGLMEQVTKSGTTKYRYSVLANGGVVAQVTQDSTAAFTENYLHRDHLGGVEAISTAAGTLLSPPQALSFDAFGKRRDKDWNGAVASGDLTAARDVTHRGFTGHEMLDNLELVHMNGRVYDPTIGRFMSVDPVFQFPENTQSLNPYSYVLNNPLSFTDPTGYACETVDDQVVCSHETTFKEASAALKPGQTAKINLNNGTTGTIAKGQNGTMFVANGNGGQVAQTLGALANADPKSIGSAASRSSLALFDKNGKTLGAVPLKGALGPRDNSWNPDFLKLRETGSDRRTRELKTADLDDGDYLHSRLLDATIGLYKGIINGLGESNAIAEFGRTDWFYDRTYKSMLRNDAPAEGFHLDAEHALPSNAYPGAASGRNHVVFLRGSIGFAVSGNPPTLGYAMTYRPGPLGLLQLVMHEAGHTLAPVPGDRSDHEEQADKFAKGLLNQIGVHP